MQIITLYVFINSNNNKKLEYQITEFSISININTEIKQQKIINSLDNISCLTSRYDEADIIDSLSNMTTGCIFLSNNKIIFLNNISKKRLKITKNNAIYLKHFLNPSKESLHSFIFNNTSKGIHIEKFTDSITNTLVTVRSEVISQKNKKISKTTKFIDSLNSLTMDSSNIQAKSESSEKITSNNNENIFKVILIDYSTTNGLSQMRNKIFDIMKSKFLITISHELNNPITALQHSIDSLSLGNPAKLRESLEAKFYCGYINFFIKVLSIKMKMSLNEEIRMYPTKIQLGSLILGNLKAIKALLKIHRIQTVYPNIDEFNKISLLYDYDSFDLLIMACFVYIKSISQKKIKLSITCHKLQFDNNFCLCFTTQFKNQEEDMNGVISSSLNSCNEEKLTITNSVATGDIIKEFIIDFSKRLDIKQEIRITDRNLLNINITFQGNESETSYNTSNLILREVKTIDTQSINKFKINNIKKSSLRQVKINIENKEQLIKQSKLLIPQIKHNKNYSTNTQNPLKTSTNIIVMEVPSKKETSSINNMSSNEEFSNRSNDVVEEVKINKPESGKSNNYSLDFTSLARNNRSDKRFETFGPNQNIINHLREVDINSLSESTKRFDPHNYPEKDIENIIQIYKSINAEEDIIKIKHRSSSKLVLVPNSPLKLLPNKKMSKAVVPSFTHNTDNIFNMNKNKELTKLLYNKASTPTKSNNNIFSFSNSEGNDDKIERAMKKNMITNNSSSLSNNRLSHLINKSYERENEIFDQLKRQHTINTSKRTINIKYFMDDDDSLFSTNNILNSQPSEHICSKTEVLIVDDEKLIRFAIKNLLKQYNLLADEAENGRECIDKIIGKSSCPSCIDYKIIFMDIMMPVMDGLEACRMIEEMYKNTEYKPKIIIISAHDTLEIFNMTKNISVVTKFLSKPISKVVFTNSMKELLYHNSS